ncbi:PAS domain S-box [Belliella baltica DSM 15883]|uniref:histidine kinase n=1 Tax=Belliella baltica (strain DSM 15883 / CIP 108006 / LMG 21964 / BA134) TaxID=866536 RepID=I3Z7C5_BELBD|nr:PAS domain S-box protein [Belliella baltica]AFL85143.1 PAS domain S-box [Belliella baltica DSM 15883]
MNNSLNLKIFEASPLPSLLILKDEPKFTLLAANKAYLEVTNSKKEDLIGKGLFEAFPAEVNEAEGDAEKLLSAIQKVIDTKQAYKAPVQKYKIPVRGTEEYLDIYWDPMFTPIFDEKGEISHILHTTEDITSTVLVEKDLESSNQKWDDLIFTIDGIFWEAKINPLQFTFVSPQAKEMLGYDTEEWKALGFWESKIYKDDKNFTINYCENQVQKGLNHNFEYRFVKKNGEVIWMSDVVSVIKEDGKPKLLRGIMTNINDRKNAEKERDKNRSKLENILDRSLDVICTIDQNGFFRDMSSASINIWGYQPQEMIGRKFMDFVHEEDKEKTKKAAEEIMNGLNMTNFENKYHRKDGSIVPIVWSAKFDSRDQIMYCVAKDGTEKQKLEDKNKLRLAINSIFTEDLDLNHIASKSLKLFLKYSQLDYAELWMLSLDNKSMILEAYDGPEHIKPKREIREYNGKVGLMSEISKREDLLYIEELQKHKSVARSEFLIKHNFKSAICYPVRFDGKVIAGILLCSIDKIVDLKDIPTLDIEFLVQLGSMIKRKKAEYELNLFFDLSPDLLCIAGFDGYFKKINQSFVKTLGYTEEEILSISYNDFTHPEDKGSTQSTVKKLSDGNNITYYESRYKTKSGKYIWLAWTSTPLLEEGLIFAIAKDITERKKQEEALKVSNKKVFEILESIQDGFCALDQDWKVTYWNTEAEKLLLKKRELILGKNIWEAFPEALNLNFYSYLDQTMKEQKPIRFEEYFSPLNLWLDLSAFPSEDGITVYFRNINDRKAAEEQMLDLNLSLEHKAKELQESNAELEQFAFVASHDLQEPLRMVTSFLHQLKKKYSPVLDQKGLQYIHYASDGAVRMRQIILDLLDYSRVGRVEYQIEKINLNELMKEISRINHTVLEEKQALLTWDNLPEINGEKGPIFQLFQNFISNGLKYQKKSVNPKVHVSFRENREYWEFAVTDNGIGIATEYQSKIFEIFQRLHHKDEYSGTGIGLAICKKIIEKYGGKIKLESEVGTGSKFVFTIKKKI